MLKGILKNDKLYCLLVIIVFVVVFLFYFSVFEQDEEIKNVQTNQAFIEGLYDGLNMSNDLEVFRVVFESLNDDVYVYPTENYYYYKLVAKGKVYGGALTLFPNERDEGKLGFGFIERNEDVSREENIYREGGGMILSVEDGVFVDKIDDFTYKVRYENKKVIFHLNDVGFEYPESARILDEEEFVGPSFDESGLQFYLLYNKEVPHMYFILNEDKYVPESFKEIGYDLIEGYRTGFVFYVDEENNRKVLVGVRGENVLRNNWYDGPFDQLPDNYVYTGQTELGKYIENSYPNTKGRIDGYGRYLDKNGTRVAVSPYIVYFSYDDLAILQVCGNINASISERYFCLTTQRYDIPSEFNGGLPIVI